MTTDYIEYVAIYHDKDLKKYTDTTDFAPHLSETFAIEWLGNQAESNNLELVWVAKASKTVYSDGEGEDFSSHTVYTSPFEEVNIYD